MFRPPVNNKLSDLPERLDWRDKGYVTEVKNQEHCGSCWAFASTGAMEGQYFRKTGKLVSLSEKNLMDCSSRYGNAGCHGGVPDFSFEYVRDNGGIDTEESYPYKPKAGPCKFKQSDVGATVQGCMDIKRDSEMDLFKAVATVGPVAIGMDASHMSFQLYKSGIYSERKCSQRKLDHGVLIVGYGKEMSHDYWLIKNSWGKTWGTEGYFKLARNSNNMCGVATQASFPTV